MTIESIEYKAGSVAARGSLVYDEKVNGPRPLLLIAPNWLGVSDASNKRAAEMAGSNYVAFVADMYGNGKIPAGPQEAAPLANALRADAPERRRRIVAALETLRAESRKRGIGDLSRQAAAGFCFGGGNVLELARTGADVKAVVCLHGDLLTPIPAKAGEIKAAVCVLHGSVDPVVPKKDRDALRLKWRRRARNGRCWFSAACCTRLRKSNPTCPALRATTRRGPAKLCNGRRFFDSRF